MAVVATSGDLSQRLQSLPDLHFHRAPSRSAHPISVNAGVRYQSVSGFGAAMTDTSAWLLEEKTPAATRALLMERLFGRSGIRLNFLRVPMGASDFTHDGTPYTYDDMPPGVPDPALRHFSIAHDEAYVLPALRQVLALRRRTQFLASPWTAPAWMKANDALGNRGDRGTLRPGADRPWAAYFVRFLRAYAAAGAPIGALTIQNEPGTATSYPGLEFPAAAEARWTTRYLLPALARAHLRPRLYAGDLGWGPNTSRFLGTALADMPPPTPVSGIAWHCYYGSPTVMSGFRAADPALDQIVDECSPGGITPTPTAEIVISSLRDWASTVALWNLALDPAGGPVQPPNHGCPGCIGLATIDERTGAAWLTRAAYQLGQVSAFVTPGARRIASNTFVTYTYPRPGVNVVSPGLDDIAFRNPDGSLVLVVYDNASRPQSFSVSWRRQTFSYRLTPGSMVTFHWNRGPRGAA